MTTDAIPHDDEALGEPPPGLPADAVPFDLLAREIVLVPIDSIVPHPMNPNIGSIDAIEESADEVGFYQIIFVQRSTSRIVAGEHRWRTLKRRGNTEAPVVFLDIDDATALRILLGDNEIPRLHSRADERATEAALAMLAEQTGSIRGTGYDDEARAALAASIAEQNAAAGAEGEGGAGGVGGSPGPSLADRFLVPPFSVLDARQGYWQDRKNQWLSLGIRSELGRPRNLLKMSDTVIEAQRHQANRSKPRTLSGGLVPNFYGLKTAYEAEHGPISTADFEQVLYDQMERGEFVLPASKRPNRSRYGSLSGGLVPDFYARKRAYEAEHGEITSAAFEQMLIDQMEAGEFAAPNRSMPSSHSGNDPNFYWKKQEAEKRLGRELTTEEFLAEHYEGPDAYVEGTSIFDPVLAEIAYRWWCPPGGRILDPFAGGSVRGIVASRLGHPYIGVDLRAEQIEANEAQVPGICRPDDPTPTWVVGDSRNVTDLVEGPVDFIFSCPPYWNLEEYSEDPSDLSTLGWEQFCADYKAIVANAVSLLTPGRFACFVVGNVRERDGAGDLRDLSSLTVAAYEEAGCVYYNDAILVTAVGSLAIRAARIFRTRKLGRTHQAVLVFLKPPLDDALEACGPIEVVDPAEAFGDVLDS